jgi:hypothetical protein
MRQRNLPDGSARTASPQETEDARALRSSIPLADKDGFPDAVERPSRYKRKIDVVLVDAADGVRE